MVQEPFLWGRAGRKLTPDQVEQEREMANVLAKGAMDYSPVGHWSQGLNRVAQGLLAGIDYRMADKAEGEIAGVNKGLISSLLGGSTPAATSSAIPASGASGEIAATSPAQPVDMTGNEVYSQFIDTVKGGVQNPYALAAIASTAQEESRFDPANVYRTWSDPSQSGQPGRAGGIMSWRGPRYEALAATGDLSPAGQAKFFLQENPQLIQALNNAGSVEEAQQLMNKAWAFAGYDKPGGETAERLATAQGFLPSFQGGGEVAAATPEAAIEAISPTQGGSLTDEVAAFEQTPAYSSQFPGQTVGGVPALDPPREVSTMPVASVPAQQPVEVAGGGGRPAGINPAIIEALTNPQASPQTQRLAGILLEQEQAKQQTTQEEQNWRARQQYEQELLSKDPLRQAQIQKIQREAQNPNGDETFFGNAVPYKDAQGNIRMGQLGNKGTFRPVPLEEGASFAPTTRSVDTGTEILTVGPGGEILDRVAKQNREEAAEKAFGSTEGKAKAETQGEYSSITSKMPGLYKVVDRLDKLAETATYTMAGQGVDWLRNQTGLDPRQAAIDRAEYTAVVDNQILPLLRDTFGAQFTNEEGLRLARTLGDADKSPTEKQALLRAFIEQKERDISALGSRIGETPPVGRREIPQGGNEVQTDIPGVKIRRKN